MQSQPINLIPNPNATPAKRSSDRGPGGLFEEMLQQGGSPIIEKPKQSPQPQEQKTEQAPEEMPEENLVVLPVGLQSALEMLNAAGQEQALAMVDEIVSILEGYQQQDNLNKDIVPLLSALSEELSALDQDALAEEASQLAEEVQARMPDNRETTENPQLEKLAAFLEKVRGDLSPSENVNDTTEMALASNLPLTKSETEQEPQTQQQAETETPQFVASVFENRIDLAEVRNQFDQQLQQAQAPVAKENLFDAMVERINMPFEENPHMEIQLKPDGLGKVSIDLVLTENGLTAKILTSDEGVRNLLAAQVTRLSEALSDKGIKVETIDVAYAPLADRGFDRPQQQQQPQRQNRSTQLPAIDGLPDAASYEPYYELSPEENSLGLSSVEFHA